MPDRASARKASVAQRDLTVDDTNPRVPLRDLYGYLQGVPFRDLLWF